jgi:hypothetical protein
MSLVHRCVRDYVAALDLTSIAVIRDGRFVVTPSIRPPSVGLACPSRLTRSLRNETGAPHSGLIRAH